MADERYQWLDQEAAERLLRGEPVDPVDDVSRAQAELLARALDAARTPMALDRDGELPGEAAALAAFRKVAAERADAVLPGSAGRAATDLGAVRIVPVHAGRRWGRSLRYGLAAAFAAVTVGGVAVAAGTGVLPLTAEPEPGRSVTAVDTGPPVTSGSPTGGAGTEVPVPTGPGVRTTTPGASNGPTTATAGPGGESGKTAGPVGTPSDGPEVRDEERAKVVKACQDFRAGRLAGSGRDRLVNALRNGETVKRYCDRILSGAPVTATTRPAAGRTPSGNGGSGSGGSGGGSDSGSADGDDKSDRGGKGRDRDHDTGRGNADRDRDQGSHAPGKHGTDSSRS
ncbi:hypothetical protein ACIRQF_20025 [Streptomyces sp. NPDC101191]|uniref:hypothetical protein n=1 Tax=Streptomyces sp. NPDC101191 TaxID=3366126 RepID=UPI003820FA04